MTRCESMHGGCSDWHDPCPWCDYQEQLLSDWAFYDNPATRWRFIAVRTRVVDIAEPDGVEGLTVIEYAVKR